MPPYKVKETVPRNRAMHKVLLNGIQPIVRGAWNAIVLLMYCCFVTALFVCLLVFAVFCVRLCVCVFSCLILSSVVCAVFTVHGLRVFNPCLSFIVS